MRSVKREDIWIWNLVNEQVRIVGAHSRPHAHSQELLAKPSCKRKAVEGEDKFGPSCQIEDQAEDLESV